MPAPPPPDPVLAQGDFDAAERIYTATLEGAPNDPAALVGLARIRLYQERRAEARKLAEQALALDADNPSAKRILAAVAAREASFTADVYQIDMPKDGARILFEATDPLPIVKVRVAGHDAFFVIDTGGPDLVIDKDFASELGLVASAGGQGVFAGGQRAGFARSTLPQFAIGSVSVRNIPVSLLPTRDFALKPGIRIDGVVGTGFLMHFLANLDYAAGALVLKARSDSQTFERDAAAQHATIVPMWLVGDHFLFARAHINRGPEGLFNIDTGLAGGGMQGTKATLAAAGVTPDESKATSGQGGGGTVRMIPFQADASLGSLTVKNVTGIYTPDGDQFGLFPFAVAGTLSHQFFRAHALTFDFEAMKIVVK